MSDYSAILNIFKKKKKLKNFSNFGKERNCLWLKKNNGTFPLTLASFSRCVGIEKIWEGKKENATFWGRKSWPLGKFSGGGF